MKKSLILPLVISFVLMILILTFFIQGCSRCGAVEDLDPSLLCTSEEDCVLVNCTDCSCDNFKVMNKDSAKKVCENVKVEYQCDMECVPSSYNFQCINHQCR